MDLTYEIVLWFLGLVIGFILGYLTNLYFYRKQRKENEASAEILKQLRQFAGAQIRLGDDKRGKIVERQDGTIAVEWQANSTERVVITDKLEVVLNKKRGDASFEIKHNGNGKETMTITGKDESGKEIRIEIPWETIQELRKKEGV
jgi:preprotein translocase subunit YajC